MSNINTQIPDSIEDLTKIEGFTAETKTAEELAAEQSAQQAIIDAEKAAEDNAAEELRLAKLNEGKSQAEIQAELDAAKALEDNKGGGEDDADKVSVFDTWKEKYGVEEFTPVADEPIDITVQNFIDKALEVKEKQLTDKIKEDFYAANPLHKLIDEGNIHNPETVEYAVLAKQYEETTIDELDIEQQETIVKTKMSLKGFDKEEIEERVQYLKDKEKLFDEATKDTKVIAGIYNKAFTEQQEIDKKAQIQMDKELTELKQSLRVQVDSDLYGIKLPKNEADDFYKYITEPVDASGNTAADIAYYKATPKQKVMIDLLLKNDFKQLGKAINTAKPDLKDLTKLNDERPKPKGSSSDSATNKSLTAKEMEAFFKR